MYWKTSLMISFSEKKKKSLMMIGNFQMQINLGEEVFVNCHFHFRFGREKKTELLVPSKT